LFSLLTYSSPNDCFTHYFSSSLLLLSSDICLSNLFVKFSSLSFFCRVFMCVKRRFRRKEHLKD
jgi:hypothetical protein